MNYLKSLPYSKFKQRTLILAAVLYFIAAIFSEGFHKLDEHDGILINTAYLLGYVDETWLSSGETTHMIRSWLQPAIYATLYFPFKLMGFHSPFTLTLVMRILHSTFAFFIMTFFSQIIQVIEQEEKWRKVYLGALLLFWPLFFFHVRATSESLSALFYLVGLTLLIKSHKTNPFNNFNLQKTKDLHLPLNYGIIIGASFALSFTMRIQMAVIIFTTCFWYLLFTRLSIKTLVIITFSFFITLFPISTIDYIGFKTWTFPPYNNYMYNTVQGVASSLGTDPFWKYLEKSFLKLIPPYSILLFAATIWVWLKRQFSLFTFITLSYFVIHSMIPHKELRFLFPILYFLPFMTIFYLKENKFNLNRNWVKLIVGLNTVLIIKVCTTPAYSSIGLFKNLYQNKVQTLYTLEPLPKLLRFYTYNKNIRIIPVKDRSKLPSGFIFAKNYETINTLNHTDGCRLLYSNYPARIVAMLPKQVIKKSKVTFLYQCSSK